MCNETWKKKTLIVQANDLTYKNRKRILLSKKGIFWTVFQYYLVVQPQDQF